MLEQKKISLLLKVFSFLFFPLAFHAPMSFPLFLIIFTGVFLFYNPVSWQDRIVQYKKTCQPSAHFFIVLVIFLYYCLRPFWSSSTNSSIRFTYELIGLTSLFYIMFIELKLFKGSHPSLLSIKSFLFWMHAGLILSASAMFCDIITDGWLWNNIHKKPFDITRYHKGVVLFLVYIGALPFFLQHKISWMFHIGFIVLSIFCGLVFNTDAVIFATFCSVIGIGFLRAKIPGLKVLSYGFYLYLLTAPLVFFYFLTPTLFRNTLKIVNYTWEHRLHSWQYICKKIAEKFFFGWGPSITESPLFQKKISWLAALDASRFAYISVDTINYPHNFALQIWLEFGLIGVLGICYIFYHGFRFIQRRIKPEQFFYVYVSLFVLAILSVGINFWQKWFWCGVTFIIIFYNFLTHKDKDNTKG